MNKQTQIDLGDTLTKNDSYTKAEIDYQKDSKIKTYAPVLLCYNPTTKEYFVSRFFKEESVTNFGCKIIK